MKNVRVARRYAVALMTGAEAAQAVETTAQDLSLIGAALGSSRELRLLSTSPVVSPGKKAAVFREVFSGKISAGTMAFLELVIAKQREEHLAEIVEQFDVLHDELLGIVTVHVTSAVELTAPQERDLSTELERYTSKKVRIRHTIDKAIRGGLVVRIGDTVLDASIRRQLEILRVRFREGGALSN